MGSYSQRDIAEKGEPRQREQEVQMPKAKETVIHSRTCPWDWLSLVVMEWWGVLCAASIKRSC